MWLHNTLQIYYHPEPLGDTESLILFGPHRLHRHTDSRGPAVRVNFITNPVIQTHNCHLAPLPHCTPLPTHFCLVFSHTSRQRAMPRALSYDLYVKQLIRHINPALQCSQGILMKTYTSFAFCFFSSSLPVYEFGMSRVETTFINRETVSQKCLSHRPNGGQVTNGRQVTTLIHILTLSLLPVKYFIQIFKTCIRPVFI